MGSTPSLFAREVIKSRPIGAPRRGRGSPDQEFHIRNSGSRAARTGGVVRCLAIFHSNRPGLSTLVMQKLRHMHDGAGNRCRPKRNFIAQPMGRRPAKSAHTHGAMRPRKHTTAISILLAGIRVRSMLIQTAIVLSP